MMTVLTSKGVVVAEQDLGLYRGPIAVMTEEVVKPLLRWQGAKISKSLWKRIVSFLVWTQKTYKSEAQLRLYYNETTSKWRAVVLPQTVRTGLSSDEIANHADRDKLFDKVPHDEGWRPAGTVHHHCTVGAFMSGTDHKDEIDQNGLHVTLGHMESDVLDFHARATFRKVLYDVDWTDWFDMPEEELKASRSARFPAAWKTCCIERVAPVFPTVRQTGYHGNWQNGFNATAPLHSRQDWRWDWEDLPPVVHPPANRFRSPARTREPAEFAVDEHLEGLDAIELLDENSDLGFLTGTMVEAVDSLIGMRGVLLLLQNKLSNLGLDLETGLYSLAAAVGAIESLDLTYLEDELGLCARAYDAGVRADQEGEVYQIEGDDNDDDDSVYLHRQPASVPDDSCDPSSESDLDPRGCAGRFGYGYGEDVHGDWGGEDTRAAAFGHMS